MFCEHCGNKLPDEARFCDNCGAKIEETKPAYEKTAPASPNSTQNSSEYYTRPDDNPYASTQYNPYSAPANAINSVLSVGNYMLMFILMYIPVVNIILLFVWSFGKNANPNKRNFARAALILGAIGLILWVLAGGVIMGTLQGIMGSRYY
ncbi:MAG: zinc-ribbon domain-containing protein [Lachnospiraceae bacterium]|nr:zinc-ribbon domain-containing protein [Lachnospiraceae bacterium]